MHADVADDVLSAAATAAVHQRRTEGKGLVRGPILAALYTPPTMKSIWFSTYRRTEIKLVAWSSGITSVFGRRAFAVLRSTCS